MNQNLSKLGTQLLEIWKQLGVSQRVSVLAATLVVIGGLVSLAFWSSRADYGLLYGKLSDTESAKVIAALDDAKVPYKIGTGGSSIMIPADKVHLMRMQLAGRGIPQGDGVGFEIFDKPNFGISDFVQRANYVRAVQGELGRTISQLDEIDSARVMVVLPENRLLLDKDKHPTASVFIRVRGNSPLQPQAINSIRFLVANSVEGLKPNNVSIVDNLGNVLSENSDNDSLTGMTTTQLTARRNLEQYLGKKAQDVLEKVLGPGQAIVRVSAEINFDTVTRTEEKFDPDGQVIRSQTKNDENNDSSTSSGGNGPVGISANTATETNTVSTASSPVNNTKNRKVVSTTEYENAKTTSSILQVAGGIKRLSTAVTVASRYEGAGTERKVTPRSTEDIEKLRRIVQNAVGTDSERGDQIALEELPFNDEFAANITRELDLQQKNQVWWELARNATYPALGVLALIVLAVIFKRTPVQEIPIGVPVGRIVGAKANGNGNGHGNGNGQGDWTRDPQPGVVTIDVLNRLVKENPANMTQAIREWMNKGRTTEN
ncbi:MAG: flagellar M-ring protein FliF [Akkermansiaceae bacterium]|nr:flagellar M-ring protein FliF [Verrucomicrobiales bacterium]